MSSDPITSALVEMQAYGLLIDRLELGPPPAGRKVWRVDVEGRSKGKRPGWYRVFEITLDDGSQAVIGSYGIWQGAETSKEKLSIRGRTLSEADRERMKQRQRELAREAEASEDELRRETSKRAAEIWKGLKSCSGAPYLTTKGVTAYGLGLARDGICVVPLRNTAGLLTQLQFIAADGAKKFLTGPGVMGSFHLIGTITDEHPLVFAEGYATAASIHEATGWPVVVCINAGNLLEVARRLRPIYPDADFVFAADDDHEKKVNTGREKVTEGAKRFRGRVVFPRFRDPAGRTDFNDVHAEQGLEAVRAQLLEVLTPSRPAESDPALDEPWTKRLVWAQRGGLVAMPRNVMTVLLNHPHWKDVYAYDAFAKRIVLRQRPPFSEVPVDDAGMPKPEWWKDAWLRDVHVIETAAWFGERDTFATYIPSGIARESILAIAERRPFHPVRDYLEGLAWDGIYRLHEFFSRYCGADDSDVNSGFGINFFLQAVARIYEPGCKADLMLVLEGDQGARKSTLAATLAGVGAYADVGEGPSNKDFFQIIQGVWLVEISEMAAFAKAESSHIKRAISVQIDRFRKSYGHEVEEFRRECVFFGTSNNSDWQKDETGGRRYMPVWVGKIDIDAVKRDRDQLWAEAVQRYKLGEPWHVLPAGALDAQEERYVEDVWAEPVLDYLNGKSGDNGKAWMPTQRDKVSVSQVLTFALDMDVKKQDRSAQTRCGNLLRRLGWRMKQERVKGAQTRIRWYYRPENET